MTLDRLQNLGIFLKIYVLSFVRCRKLVLQVIFLFFTIASCGHFVSPLKMHFFRENANYY